MDPAIATPVAAEIAVACGNSRIGSALESARRRNNGTPLALRVPWASGPDGLARRGVLVRHLVMPGQEDEAAAIFEWLAREVSPDTYVNIMGQYRPDYQVGQIAANGAVKYPEIRRRPTPLELESANDAARRAGLWRFDERWARGLMPWSGADA